MASRKKRESKRKKMKRLAGQRQVFKAADALDRMFRDALARDEESAPKGALANSASTC